MESCLGSSLNQIQGWTTVRESHSGDLEQGPLDMEMEPYCTVLVKKACSYFKFHGIVQTIAQPAHSQPIGRKQQIQAQLTQPGASLFVQHCSNVGWNASAALLWA